MISLLFNFVADNTDFVFGFVVPFVLATVGLLGPIFFFEWAVRQAYFEPYLITYKEGQQRYGTKTGTKNLNRVAPHDELVTMALCRVPFVAFLGAAALYGLKLDMFSIHNVSHVPRLSTMMFQYACYYYCSDFIGWIGHYAAHKSDFLWRHVHAMHHEDATPTTLSAPYSTLYDYLLFGATPNIVSAAILKPHALVFCAGLFTNTYGVAYVHSGIHHPVFDFFLSMGFLLPFHASPRLHDRHHRRAGRKTQDLGEHVWLWDYLAGTLSQES